MFGKIVMILLMVGSFVVVTTIMVGCILDFCGYYKSRNPEVDQSENSQEDDKLRKELESMAESNAEAYDKMFKKVARVAFLEGAECTLNLMNKTNTERK